jgi:putative nucleotidyltransferase with HDIG domain
MALKQIRKDQVRAGMWIEEIKGFWFLHPFWSAQFLLQHPDDVRTLQRSWISGVVIDTARGLDVEQRQPCSPARPQARSVAGPLRRVTQARSPVSRRLAPRKAKGPPTSCSMTAELGRAGRIASKARKMMRQLFDEVRLGKVVDSERFVPLVDDIAASLLRNRSTMTSVLRLKQKDEYTYMHSVSVAALMIGLSRELGLEESQVREAGMAGLLHDIGKMTIDDAILGKPGALTSEEFAKIKSHPERGHALLRRDEDITRAVMDVALHHHEKIDGTGYPHSLKHEDIGLLARMGAICDVYDAVTSNRPYKDPWTPAQAIREMQEWNGHFDAQLLDAFVRSVGLYPVGSLVRLESGRLALVTEANRSDPARPMVRIFAEAAGFTALPVEDLTLETGVDAIAEAEHPETRGLADWEELWPELARVPKGRIFDRLFDAEPIQDAAPAPHLQYG